MAALAALLAGCGYRTGSMMPEGIEKVAVGIASNETRYRQVEITYTRQLTQELSRRSHVSLCSPEEAQAVIRGRIMDVRRVVLVEDDLDRVLEGAVVVTVEVTLEDPRSGRSLVHPFVLRRRAPHVLVKGETLEGALDEAMADLARDTVNRIQAESFYRSRVTSDPRVPLPESRPVW